MRAILLILPLLLAGCNTDAFDPLLGDSYRRQKFVDSQPALNERSRSAVLNGEVYVGMSAAAAEASWGPPSRINRSHTRYGTREQWVYRGVRGKYLSTSSSYLYVEAGEVTAIQN